jgi:hypothetical protein
VYQVFVLLVWLAVGLTLRSSPKIAGMAAANASAAVPLRLVVASVWVLGLVMITIVMLRMRRIAVDDDDLIISGIVRAWTVPLASLRAVRVEVQPFGSMPKWAVLELDAAAACGSRVHFIPSSASSGAIGGADYKALLDRARAARRGTSRNVATGLARRSTGERDAPTLRYPPSGERPTNSAPARRAV